MNQIIVPLPACPHINFTVLKVSYFHVALKVLRINIRRLLHGGATFSLPEAIAEAWVWGFDFYTMLE